MAPETVSVVVNTYNRAPSLRLTLAGLAQLDYPQVEVVVVNGPSTDDTEAVMAAYQGRIKAARCPERNLSMSRNVGIAAAAGDIVAFIDDDAYPDPAWLDRLMAAYADPEVAGAGGPVYDHTGARFQTRYIISDRIGRSTLVFDHNPSAWLNLPGAGSFPSLLGTNSSFRRDRLLEIGGFDEEFEYFLDETDVCARLVDAGYVVAQLDDGAVYHKFLPSDIRGESRAARDRYVVAKNTCYFALKNAREGSSFFAACTGLAEFVETQRRDYRWNIDHGLLARSGPGEVRAGPPPGLRHRLGRFPGRAGQDPPGGVVRRAPGTVPPLSQARGRRATSSTSAWSARTTRPGRWAASDGTSTRWPRGWPTPATWSGSSREARATTASTWRTASGCTGSSRPSTACPSR